MKTSTKIATFACMLFVTGFLYMGADWQTEVCVYNICNGWEPYAWIATTLQISNWAAFDLWRLARYILVAWWVMLAMFYFAKDLLREGRGIAE